MRLLTWLHIAASDGFLAIAALVQQKRRPAGGGHVSLITFGSPAGKLYAWAFPAYITTELLTPLAPGGGGDVHDWLNFYYPTDPIGGPVAEKMISPARELVDKPLPDPAESWYVYGQPLPVPRGHSGYWADSQLWRAINHVAAASQPAAPIPAAQAPNAASPPAAANDTAANDMSRRGGLRIGRHEVDDKA